jgi:hypothetical protein
VKKSLFFVLVLAMVVAGGASAQQWGGKKNFVSADLGIVVSGARYERLLTPKFSVGGDFYWANSFIIWNELEVGAFGRYYIWQGLFAELGLGFHTHTGVESVSYTYSNVTVTGNEAVLTTGFAISPGLGWKFDPGNGGGFFVEPGIIIPITIGEKTSGWGWYESKAGASVGFVLYCGLGWAF